MIAMLRNVILMIAISLFIAGCSKESSRKDRLSGTWDIVEIDLLNDTETYTMEGQGTFEFQKSDKEFNAGGTVYGKNLSCRADMPEVTGQAPAALLKFKTRTIYFTEPTDTDNYNYSSFYRGLIGWFELDNLVNYMSCDMSLQNDGTLVVKIGNKAKLNSNDYSIILIHLKRR